MKECRILKWEQSEKKKKGKAKEKDDKKTIAILAAHADISLFCADGHVNIICYDSD